MVKRRKKIFTVGVLSFVFLSIVIFSGLAFFVFHSRSNLKNREISLELHWEIPSLNRSLKGRFILKKKISNKQYLAYKLYNNAGVLFIEEEEEEEEEEDEDEDEDEVGEKEWFCEGICYCNYGFFGGMFNYYNLEKNKEGEGVSKEEIEDKEKEFGEGEDIIPLEEKEKEKEDESDSKKEIGEGEKAIGKVVDITPLGESENSRRYIGVIGRPEVVIRTNSDVEAAMRAHNFFMEHCTSGEFNTFQCPDDWIVGTLDSCKDLSYEFEKHEDDEFDEENERLDFDDDA